MSRKKEEVKEPAQMEIVVERANKTYEPGEKVVGFINTVFAFEEASNFKLKALSYMDTVSIIRGNVGRPPLDEKERIYMMKKDLEHKSITPKAPVEAAIKAPKGSRSFEFILDPTEAGEKLIDSYTGVDFSVLYKVYASCRTKSGKNIE